MSAFTDFVNLELPKRISINIPPSGNLEAGKILQSTGLGLGVELVTAPGGISNISAVLSNNTSGNIQVGDITEDQSVIIEYILKRDDKIQKGHIEINHDALTSELIHEFSVHSTGGELGVIFETTISGNELRLNYTVTDDIYDIGMVYNLIKHDLII